MILKTSKFSAIFEKDTNYRIGIFCFRKIELISSYGGDTESESEESDLVTQNVSFYNNLNMYKCNYNMQVTSNFHDDTKFRSYMFCVTHDSKVFNLI